VPLPDAIELYPGCTPYKPIFGGRAASGGDLLYFPCRHFKVGTLLVPIFQWRAYCTGCGKNVSTYQIWHPTFFGELHNSMDLGVPR
jgi:hypothetical protein